MASYAFWLQKYTLHCANWEDAEKHEKGMSLPTYFQASVHIS